MCLSWTRKGNANECTTNNQKTAGSVSDVDTALDGVAVGGKPNSNQLSEAANSHQVGFDSMPSFAANTDLFAAGGPPAPGMFVPANILAGVPQEMNASVMTSNANWMMLPSNANSVLPTSNVIVGGQENVSSDRPMQCNVADAGGVAKVLSCDVGTLANSQTGAVTIGNSGETTSVTQSINLKTPIMATNQGGANIAATQQQHIINLTESVANQHPGMPMLQNPAMIAGGPQLRGNIVMHNGQLILINDQAMMPTVVKNETTDKQVTCISAAVVSSAGVAVPSPGLSSGRSSLHGTPASTSVPSHSVASTQLYTQSVTSSNSLMPTPDSGWTNQCVTVNTPQGVVTMNTTPSQPNQLPSALVLPNGQIIPVVTQPNLLFPQQQCLPVNGGLLMAANNPGLVNQHLTAVTTVASRGAIDMCNQMVAPQLPVMTAPHSSNVTVSTPSGITPDIASTLPLGVAMNPMLPFHPQLAAPSVGMPMIAGQHMAAVRAPSMQQMPLGVPVQNMVPGKPEADRKQSSAAPAAAEATSNVVTTAASPAPLTNLPSTVSAIITPEGNIILTLPPSSAAGNTGNITFDQNGFPLLSQPAGKAVATGATGNKSKKPGQRVLMPKPSQQTATPSGGRAINTPVSWNMANGMHGATTEPVATTVTTSDKNDRQDALVADLLNVSVAAGGPVDAAPSTTSPSGTITADLLAQATESIFSSALTDISPPISGTPSGYYNAANEDNPLHIDTSDVAPPEDGAGTNSLMQPFTKPTAALPKKPRPSKSSKKKTKPCAATEQMVSSNQAQSLDAASSQFLQQLATEKMDDDEESDINDFADLIRMPYQETPECSAQTVAPTLTVSGSSVTDITASTTTVVSASVLAPPRPQQQQAGELAPPRPQQQQAGELAPPRPQQQQAGELAPPRPQQQQAGELAPPRPQQQQAGELAPPRPQQQQAGGVLQRNEGQSSEGPARQTHPVCARPQAAAAIQPPDKPQQDTGIFKSPEQLTTDVVPDARPKKKKVVKSCHKEASEVCSTAALAAEKMPQFSEGADLMHLSMPYLSDMTDRGKAEIPVTRVPSLPNVSMSIDLTLQPPSHDPSSKQFVLHSPVTTASCVTSIQSAVSPKKVSPKNDACQESRRKREAHQKKSKPKRNRSHQKISQEENVCSMGDDAMKPANTNKLAVFDFDQELMDRSDKSTVFRPASQDDGPKKTMPVGGDGNARKRRRPSHSSKKKPQEPLKPQEQPTPTTEPMPRTEPLKPEDIIPDSIMFDDSELELSRVLEQVESYGQTLHKVNSFSTSLSPPLSAASMSPKKSYGQTLHKVNSFSTSLSPPLSAASMSPKKSYGQTLHKVNSFSTSLSPPLGATSMSPKKSYGQTLHKVNSFSTSLSPPLSTASMSPKKSQSRRVRSGDSAEAPTSKKRKQDSASHGAADSVFSDHYTQNEAMCDAIIKKTSADTLRTVEKSSNDTVNELLFGPANDSTPEGVASSKHAQTTVAPPMLTSVISPLPWTTMVGMTGGTQCNLSTATTTNAQTVPSDSSARMAADLSDAAFAFPSPDAAVSLTGLSPRGEVGNIATTAASNWSGTGEMISPQSGVTEPMACHRHLVPLARQLAPPKLYSGGPYASQSRDVAPKVTPPSGRISKPHKSPSGNHSTGDTDVNSQRVQSGGPPTHINESPPRKHHNDTVATAKPVESVHLTNPFSSLDDSAVPSDDGRMMKMSEYSNKQRTNAECRQQTSRSSAIAQATPVSMVQQEQLPYSAESLLSPSSEHNSWSGLKNNAPQSVLSHNKSPPSVISQTPVKHEQPKRSPHVHSAPVSFYSQGGFAGNQADFSRASPKQTFPLSVSCSQARQPHHEAFTFSPSFGVPASLAGNVRSSSARANHTVSPPSSSLLMTTTAPCSSSSTFSFSLSSTSNVPAMNSASYGGSLSRLQFYPPQPDLSLNLHHYDEHAMGGRHTMCSTGHDKMVSPAGIHASFPQFGGLVDGGRPQPGIKGVSRSQHYNEPHRLTHPDKEPYMNSSASLVSNSSVRMTSAGHTSISSSPSVSRTGSTVRRSPQMVYEPGPYFGPTGFPVVGGPNPVTSPPLHHTGPLLGHQRTGVAPNSGANKQRAHYDFPSSSELPFGGLPFVPPSFDPALHLTGRHTPTNSHKEAFSLAASLNLNAGHKSGGANPQGVVDSRKSSALLLPPSRSKPVGMPPSSHAAVPQHLQPPKPSRSSKSSKKKQQPPKQQQPQQLLHQQQHHEIDPYVAANALFDPSRSMTPYFPIGSLSPPPRNLGGSEGPTYFGAGNFFCNSQRPPSLANSKPLQHKNSGPSAVPGTADLSFNALFPPSRHQNGLGINFQPPPGFGMNHHAAMHAQGQIMPQAMAMPPHMANFNLSNIFSDMNNPAPQPDGSLNISPIKFPHHSMPLQPGMDPNTLHHQAAASSLYTNRSQMPPPGLHSMSINSLLSHQHHGFDARGIGPPINSSVAPPFGGHAHSFGIPPLNFPMHDH